MGLQANGGGLYGSTNTAIIVSQSTFSFNKAATVRPRSWLVKHCSRGKDKAKAAR